MSRMSDSPEGMTVQHLQKGRRRINNSTMRLFLLETDADGTETIGAAYDVEYPSNESGKEALQWAISRIDSAKTEAEIAETPMMRKWAIFG